MKKIVVAAAAAMECPHCGGMLTWAPDRWLAAHEQVSKCTRCGRLHVGAPTRDRIATVTHPVGRSGGDR
jgi:DNA-directed RNA polymerase subunit RPC12/RpoP